MYICPDCDFMMPREGSCPEHECSLVAVGVPEKKDHTRDSEKILETIRSFLGETVNDVNLAEQIEQTPVFTIFQGLDDFTDEQVTVIFYNARIEPSERSLFKSELALIIALSKKHRQFIPHIEKGRIHEGFAYIIVSGYPYVSLRKVLDIQGTGFSEDESISFITPLFEFVKAAHLFTSEIKGKQVNRLTLGDITPDSLFFSEQNSLVFLGISPLCDMGGTVTPFKQSVFEREFPNHFNSPEKRADSDLGPWIDAWQLGKLFCYLLGISGSMDEDNLNNFEFTYPETRELIKGLLAPEIENRTTVGNGLKILTQIIESHEIPVTQQLTSQEDTANENSRKNNQRFTDAQSHGGTIEETPELYLCPQTNIQFIKIPGEDFLMGAQSQNPEDSNFDAQAYSDESPVFRVSLSPFYLSQHLVTNEEYSYFVEKTGGQHGWWCHPGCPKNNIENHSLKVAKNHLFFKPEQPVVGVCWWDAYAFCKFFDFRLPTEAEWEFAALGGKPHYTFPWGIEFLPEKAQIDQDWVLGHTSPVGSYPPNEYGLTDMSGNVWQWMNTEYVSHEEKKPAMPFKGVGEPTLRGGSWGSRPESARIRYRSHSFADYGNYGCGFRVAMNLQNFSKDS